jgi:hypothetical protein
MHRLDAFPGEELIGQYRTLFSSRSGLDVLSHMLYDLGVFEQVAGGAEDIALKNYGNRLLSILAGGEVAIESMKELLEKIMRQPLPKPPERNLDNYG